MRKADAHHINLRAGGIILLGILLAIAKDAKAQVPFVQAPPLSMSWVEADDRAREEAGELALYARHLPLMATSDDSGLWTEEHGLHVWRLGLSSPGALGLEFLLDEMNVPEGSSLRLVGDHGELLAEPISLAPGITETSTPLIFGDACVLEYREPAGPVRQGRFRITHLSHAYRDIGDMDQREGNCHVNVACSPEADGWDGPIRATVRISVVVPQGSGWCTGTLVNNARQDCTPYILTAFHCGRTSTSSQFNQYKFYFNFQYASCSGGSYSTAQYITGAQLKAYSDDYNPALQGLGGSDFMLLRANTSIPENYQPYWAGWDARPLSTVTDDGVCTHHPTGAPKRISSYTQTLTTGHPMASSGLTSHYKVVWASTEHGWGITEVGSSGAGLFKQHPEQGAVLIGTCTGNSSGMSCSNHTGYAYFGKMSYHWTQNPNAANIKLKPWLDPDNSGTLVLGGSANPCASPAYVQETVPTGDRHPYPNPADQDVSIPIGQPVTAVYQVIDAMGRTLMSGPCGGPIAQIPVSSIPAGSYHIRITVQDQYTRSFPIMVIH